MQQFAVLHCQLSLVNARRIQKPPNFLKLFSRGIFDDFGPVLSPKQPFQPFSQAVIMPGAMRKKSDSLVF
jgi:hypothetical protein